MDEESDSPPPPNVFVRPTRQEWRDDEAGRALAEALGYHGGYVQYIEYRLRLFTLQLNALVEPNGIALTGKGLEEGKEHVEDAVVCNFMYWPHILEKVFLHCMWEEKHIRLLMMMYLHQTMIAHCSKARTTLVFGEKSLGPACGFIN